MHTSVKKGQITIFIILGFLALVFFAFVVYLKDQENDSLMKTSMERTLTKNQEIEIVRIAVQDCLDQAARKSILRFQHQGGHFDLSNPLQYEARGQTRVAYGLRYSTDLVPTKEAAEITISQDIKEQLNDCQLPELEDAEVIPAGEKNVIASLEKNRLIVSAQYPLRIRKGQKEDIIREFETEVQTQLKETLEAAHNIISLARYQASPLNLAALDFSCRNIIACAEENMFIKIISYDRLPTIFQFAFEEDFVADSCSKYFLSPQGVCNA